MMNRFTADISAASSMKMLIMITLALGLMCLPACDGGAGLEQATATCGDGACNGSETCSSCAPDCGACNQAYCGDGACNGLEFCGTCAADCGACPVLCGDIMCKTGEKCEAGACIEDVCVAQCDGKQCGPDGCDGICGSCQQGMSCQDGVCVDGPCEPACSGKQCGSDGCGGSCGACQQGWSCQGGVCAEGPCEPVCAGKQCGPDGCDGSCGSCAQGWSCVNSVCKEDTCQPVCSGKQCGPDGCGGSCGTCAQGLTCKDGVCATGPCEASCGGKECGDDGCGGSCGSCGWGEVCNAFSCVDELNCEELLECAIDCKENDPTEACMEYCIAGGSQAAVKQFDDYLECWGECDDTMCLAENCAVEYSSCFYESTGSLDCVGIIDCYIACPEGDSVCYDGCEESGTLEAQAEMFSYQMCLTAICPDGSDECVTNAKYNECASFQAACYE